MTFNRLSSDSRSKLRSETETCVTPCYFTALQKEYQLVAALHTLEPGQTPGVYQH